MLFDNICKIINPYTLSQCRETYFYKNLYIEWIYNILFYFMCGRIQLYITYSWYLPYNGHPHGTQVISFRRKTQSERKHLQNKGRDFMRFASGRRKSCPSIMIAVSRLRLVFDVALVVKKVDLFFVQPVFILLFSSNPFHPILT